MQNSGHQTPERVVTGHIHSYWQMQLLDRIMFFSLGSMCQVSWVSGKGWCPCQMAGHEAGRDCRARQAPAVVQAYQSSLAHRGWVTRAVFSMSGPSLQLHLPGMNRRVTETSRGTATVQWKSTASASRGFMGQKAFMRKLPLPILAFLCTLPPPSLFHASRHLPCLFLKK